MAKPTAQRILDAAEELIARKGLDGMSLGDVTDRVGIRGPGLFHYFKNKQELYEAVLARLLDPFFAMLDEFVEPPHTPERSETFVTRVMHHHAHNPNLARLIQHATLAGGSQFELLVERWYRPFFDRIGRKLRDSGREGETFPSLPGELTPIVIMGLNNLILGYVTLAPLHSRLLGVDPLDEKLLAHQVDYLVHLVRGLPDLPDPSAPS